MTGVPRNRRLAWAAVLVAAAALCPAAPTRAADPPEKLVAELEQVRQESIAAARAIIFSEVRPIDDIRSTAKYRAAVAANLLEEFLLSLA